MNALTFWRDRSPSRPNTSTDEGFMAKRGGRIEKLHRRLDREADELGLWSMDRAQARHRLIEHYLPFAERMAQIRSSRNANAEFDDCYSEASMALIHAVDAYDPQNDAGAAFTTFASHRVYGGAVDAERQNDWVGHKVRLADRQSRSQIEAGESLESGRLPLPQMVELTDVAFQSAVSETEDEPDCSTQLNELLDRADPVTKFFARSIAEHGLYADELPQRWGVSIPMAGRLCRWTIERLRQIPCAA